MCAYACAQYAHVCEYVYVYTCVCICAHMHFCMSVEAMVPHQMSSSRASLLFFLIDLIILDRVSLNLELVLSAKKAA